MSYLIDLHTHSTASDGTIRPAELIQMAAALGKEQSKKVVLALTDHDTVSGISEFLEEAAHHDQEITAIGGLEFSTYYKSESIHILGYGIDIHNQVLLNALEKYRNSRDTRNEKIVKKLQEHGMEITMDDIQPKNPGDSIGRPLMAKHLMKMNYVSSIKEAFDLYLGNGKSCYVPREKASPQEVIDLIHQAGGLAFLAHPVLYKKISSKELTDFINSLKDMGLDGMEIYYSRNHAEDTAYYKEVAQSLNLLLSGGSDYHGTIKPDISLFTGTGDLKVEEDVLSLLSHLSNNGSAS